MVTFCLPKTAAFGHGYTWLISSYQSLVPGHRKGHCRPSPHTRRRIACVHPHHAMLPTPFWSVGRNKTNRQDGNVGRKEEVGPWPMSRWGSHLQAPNKSSSPPPWCIKSGKPWGPKRGSMGSAAVGGAQAPLALQLDLPLLVYRKFILDSVYTRMHTQPYKYLLDFIN